MNLTKPAMVRTTAGFASLSAMFNGHGDTQEGDREHMRQPDTGRGRTRGNVSATLTCALSIVAMQAACGPTHDCVIQGRVEATDGAGGVPCSFDMYLDGRANRLTHISVVTGQDFGLTVTKPIIEPRERWHAVVRCNGYEDQKTPAFDMGVGWGTCQTTQLDAIAVRKSRP